MMVMKSVPIRVLFAVVLNPSAIQGETRLRVMRTLTVTLSAIGYRLSATGSL